MLSGHQVQVVGLQVGRAALLDRLLFFRQQLQLQGLDDCLRNLVLQREDVVQVAVVAFGPEVVVARRLDQLRRDAHATAGAAHAALEHVVDLQLPRHLRQVDVLALERERSVARDDGERGDLAQVRDDVLADAVAEIFLLQVAAHVGERQHADRYALLSWSLPVAALTPADCVPGSPCAGARSSHRARATSPGTMRCRCLRSTCRGRSCGSRARPSAGGPHRTAPARGCCDRRPRAPRPRTQREPTEVAVQTTTTAAAASSSASIWSSNCCPASISGSHQTVQPFASIAATSGATRALSLRAYETKTSAMLSPWQLRSLPGRCTRRISRLFPVRATCGRVLPRAAG